MKFLIVTGPNSWTMDHFNQFMSAEDIASQMEHKGLKKMQIPNPGSDDPQNDYFTCTLFDCGEVDQRFIDMMQSAFLDGDDYRGLFQLAD